MWEVEESSYGAHLRTTLNSIERRGGTVFQILENGPRKDFVHVVWFKHADDAAPDLHTRREAMKPRKS